LKRKGISKKIFFYFFFFNFFSLPQQLQPILMPPSKNALFFASLLEARHHKAFSQGFLQQQKGLASAPKRFTG
jgi:hypothetical protein